MFRNALGRKLEKYVPECVIWLKSSKRGLFEQICNGGGLIWSIISLVNVGLFVGDKTENQLALAIDCCVSVWNIGELFYETYSLWGYWLRSKVGKEAVLEEIVQKMEESLGIIGGVAGGMSRNSKNVTWQACNSIQQQLTDLQLVNLLDRLDLIEERLAQWRGE